jgi:hypothetical protein
MLQCNVGRCIRGGVQSDAVVARMLFVLISTLPLEIDSKVLGEDSGDLLIKCRLTGISLGNFGDT